MTFNETIDAPYHEKIDERRIEGPMHNEVEELLSNLKKVDWYAHTQRVGKKVSLATMGQIFRRV